VQQIGAAIGEGLIESRIPKPSRVYMTIDRAELRTVTGVLIDRMNARYVVGAGTDIREADDCFLISHFFALDEDGIYVALHMKVPADDPKVQSITGMIPGANWSEREIYDMIGVEMEGHPDPRRLVVADDWPEGVFPMRCDTPHDVKPVAQEDARQVMEEVPDGAHVVPIGPFFPVLEEPAHFRVFVEGEHVVGCDYRGFFSHRGIEKLASTELTYNQIPFIAERICGICGFVHSTCYCQAVEEAAGIAAPARANWIRAIMLEFERIHSHILWLGIAGHIIGFDTILMQSWRMREPLMWLTERISGNRKTYGMNIVGGVRRDVPDDTHGDILEVMDELEAEWKTLLAAIPGDEALAARLSGMCVLTAEQAAGLGLTGPCARASGLPIDVRVDHPYGAYAHLDTVPKIMARDGDVFARTMVRLQETLVSIDTVREVLDTMPDGPILAEIGEDIEPGKQGIGSVEAPRGEVLHWVLTGENNRPERWRVRAPTYMNLQSIPVMVTGDTLADVPIGIGIIDPCFACTERLEVVDANSGRMRVYSGDELIARKPREDEV